MALFIGGPLDGQTIEVEPSRTFVEVAVTPKLSTSDINLGQPIPKTQPTNVFYYKKETLSCPSSIYPVFVPRAYTCEDVLETLLEGYRQVDNH